MSRILFLALAGVTGEMIAMTLCKDNYCSETCISWMTKSDVCSICKGDGNCSVTNPSIITNTDSVTFYSDSSCSAVITELPIQIDDVCHNFPVSGSYKAQNISLFMVIVVGSLLGSSALLSCLFIFFCKNRKRVDQPKSEPRYEYSYYEPPSYYPQSSYYPQVAPDPSAPDPSAPDPSAPSSNNF